MASDTELGLHRRITRRDFIQGVAAPVGGALVMPRWVQALKRPQAFAPEQASGYYPPGLTGMRGSHDGSFEVAHRMRDQRGWDFSGAMDTGESYDLVVVGGGISGLASAHFFLQHFGPDARVLVLDNHDDFGGHAKRKEFHYHGRTLALNGGTLNIESPDRYNLPALWLFADIGIDLDRFQSDNADRRSTYRRMGLGDAYFVDRETWGADRLVRNGAGDPFSAEFAAKTRLSGTAQRDLLRLYGSDHPGYLLGLSSAEKKERLAKTSYADFLTGVVNVDPQVLWFLQRTGAGRFVTGIDTLPALLAWEMGQPGFVGIHLEPTPEGVLADLPGGQHGRQRPGRGAAHFPDGNATVARLMVRWLVPDAVPGSTQEDVGLARVDYAALDRLAQAARIRLNSTVVRVRHTGAGPNAEVEVSYVRGKRTHHVRGRYVVMACWNTIIPYLVPELPAEQKAALAFCVKAPLVYTSVAVRNWMAFEKLEVSRVSTPTMYHASVRLSEAVSLGELRHAETPSEPIVLSMTRYPVAIGKTRKEQYRVGRADLLSTTFETFERKIRDQLNCVLGGGGFDAARDILAIRVNRLPHGHAYTYNTLYDPMAWAFTATDDRPCVRARQPFGSIAIANSDAAASPHTDAAILEEHRAVQEVLQRRAMPVMSRRQDSQR